MFLNPIAFKSLSFQLSFVSTLGLIFFSDFFEKKLSKLPSILSAELAPTLAATLSTFPIIVGNFGRISLVSPLVNMIVLPIVPIIMLFGVFVFIALPFGAIPSMLMSFLVFVPLEYLVSIVKLFGEMEFSSINIGKIVPIIQF